MTDISEQQLDELEELISQEKMQAALECHNDIWASCAAEGIETDILIDAAIETALREVIKLHGEDCAEDMLNNIRERIQVGEFSPKRTLQ